MTTIALLLITTPLAFIAGVAVMSWVVAGAAEDAYRRGLVDGRDWEVDE